jgi:HNH endonuclease
MSARRYKPSHLRNGNPLSPVRQVRAIPPLVRLFLFVQAGGRCEFDGCNKYLLEHHVTLREGNFAEVAHIVAFQPEGPRGRAGQRPREINNVGNLMLLCPDCHKVIDDHPERYTPSGAALQESWFHCSYL